MSFFFQAEDGIRDRNVTGVQTCALPIWMEVLHQSQLGRVYTYIVRGSVEEVRQRVEETRPLFVEALPLSLEEIFIYEMGGDDYRSEERRVGKEWRDRRWPYECGERESSR